MSDLSKKFAWFYLIKNGYAGVEPAYYGGWTKDGKSVDYTKLPKLNDLALKKIKAKGVDWEKTAAPHTYTEDIFNGTFCDNATKEMLSGTLVLEGNGELIKFCSDTEVEEVFNIMADLYSAKEEFFEIFGEDL